MITTLIALLITLIMLIRLSRWLALVQQKEYRFDRLSLFLKTREAMMDWVLPWAISLNRIPVLSDFKRPKLTPRVVTVGFLSLSLLVLFIILFPQLQSVPGIIALYLAIPALVLLAAIPSALPAHVLTYVMLLRARQRLEAGKPLLIGITGSYGKSSTKHLVAHLLSQQEKVFTTPKSYNTRYSVAKSIVTGYNGERIAVLEYGAYTKGEIKTLASWFKPDVAIITGITEQHLGLFGSVEEIIKAKSELVKALSQQGTILYNGSDPNVIKLIETTKYPSSIEAIPYAGEGALSTAVVSHASLDADGSLSFTWEGKQIRTQLVGKHYLPNIQCAIAAAILFLKGSNKQAIVQGLESFANTGNYIQAKQTKTGLLIIDDGKTSNPKGFLAALHIIKDISKKRKFLLTSGIVDLGTQSHTIHQELAREARNVVDIVLYTGQDGVEEFKTVFKDSCITDKQKINDALHTLGNDTVLLIEGFIKQDVLQALETV